MTSSCSVERGTWRLRLRGRGRGWRDPRGPRPDRRAAPGLCALPRHPVGHWEGRDWRAGQAPGRPWGTASRGSGGTRRPGSLCWAFAGERELGCKARGEVSYRSHAGPRGKGPPPAGAPCRGPTSRWTPRGRKRRSGSRVAERRASVKVTPRSGVCSEARVNEPRDSATPAIAYRA